jgi:hypothetical protein
VSEIRISGRVYAERPPSSRVSGGESRRRHLIAESLRSAAEFCSERERRLYKSILEVLAHAENLRDQGQGNRLPDPTLGDLLPHALEQ